MATAKKQTAPAKKTSPKKAPAKKAPAKKSEEKVLNKEPETGNKAEPKPGESQSAGTGPFEAINACSSAANMLRESLMGRERIVKHPVDKAVEEVLNTLLPFEDRVRVDILTRVALTISSREEENIEYYEEQNAKRRRSLERFKGGFEKISRVLGH